MKPQELGAALKHIAEFHAAKRSFGDSYEKPARELDFSQKGGMISLDAEGTRDVAKLTRELLQQRPKIASLCTPETVRFEIIEAVKRFVYSITPLDPSKEAEQLIKRLTGRPCDFVCVFPVKGGRIVAMMRLNRTLLVPSLQMIPTALTSEFPDVIKFPANVLDVMVGKVDPAMPAPNLGEPSKNEFEWYVVSQSLALDDKMAVEKALRIVEEDIGLLRFRMLKGAQSYENPVSVEVMKDSVLTIKKGMALGALGSAEDDVSCTSSLLPSALIEIPELLDFHAHNANEDFRKIAGILNDENRTKLQERLYLAYTWLNKALKQRDPREQLLDSIIGMEALMLQPHESKGDTLAERVAFCLGHDFSSRKKIFDRVKDLVRMRNRVSHEGETNVVGEQADSSIRVLSNIIEVMAERCEKESAIDEFIKEIEVLKFS